MALNYEPKTKISVNTTKEYTEYKVYKEYTPNTQRIHREYIKDAQRINNEYTKST